MRPNFRPLRGLVVFLFLVLLTSVAPAADKKRKSAESETAAKAKAKPTQKVNPKQQAKAARESGKKNERQQLARKKKNDDEEKRDKKRGKDVLVAKVREAGSKKTAKNAKPDAEKKNEKTKDKSAQREQGKKPEKKEVLAKHSEKATKPSAKPPTKAQLAAAKIKPDSKPELRSHPKEEKAKELPSVKFALRPIAKVIPRVELKFSVARAVAGTSFDAPPPRDNGPDVIDVIEHDSPEAGRLDDVLRSEMKTLQFSGVPSNSRKRMDVGKMDAERIKQIQEALAKNGYYAGEISGQYDDATIEAMRKFQVAHKVDVTGYATAQSLRLLGLTDW